MALPGLSTSAFVHCKAETARFANVQGVPDPNFITMDMTVLLNGMTGEFGTSFTFAKAALTAAKHAAVRNRVNAVLTSIEVGNTLVNAEIQISGLPV